MSDVNFTLDDLDDGAPLLGFDAEELFDKWGVDIDPLECIRDYIADRLDFDGDEWVLDPDTKADMVFFLEQLCKNLDDMCNGWLVFKAVLQTSNCDDLNFAEYFSALLPLMVVDNGS